VNHETLHDPSRRHFLIRLVGGFAAGVFVLPSVTACANLLPQPGETPPTPSFTPTPEANPTEVPDGIYKGHAKDHIKTVKKSDIEAELSALALDPGGNKPPYLRRYFGDGWEEEDECDTRDELLIRDLSNEVVGPKCEVLSGKLYDPYSLTETDFVKSVDPSRVQVEHRIAVKVAWYDGLYKLKDDPDELERFYNDHKNLEIVKGTVNRDKSDDRYGEWLPPNPGYICSFTAMYIDVKEDWDLTVKVNELTALRENLTKCGFEIPVIE
jgi:hypothetical protein